MHNRLTPVPEAKRLSSKSSISPTPSPLISRCLDYTSPPTSPSRVVQEEDDFFATTYQDETQEVEHVEDIRHKDDWPASTLQIRIHSPDWQANDPFAPPPSPDLPRPSSRLLPQTPLKLSLTAKAKVERTMTRYGHSQTPSCLYLLISMIRWRKQTSNSRISLVHLRLRHCPSQYGTRVKNERGF